jgi:type VII secretion integral membrane protein EccD
MSAPTVGLARVTIRAPKRRLDLSMPHQVPLAELLPDLVRHAGETRGTADAPYQAGPPDGWMLRRGDGAPLTADATLAHQGVRDGDVLYLVPRRLTWPEPAYDDVVDEVAVGTRRHRRPWDAAATRFTAVAGAAVALGAVLAALARTVLTGLGPHTARIVAAAVAAGLVCLLWTVAAVAGRLLRDRLVALASGGFALLFAAVAGGLSLRPGPGAVLAAAVALTAASLVTALMTRDGRQLAAAGVTVGLLTGIGGLVGLVVPAAGAAAVVAVATVVAVGVAPSLVVRLARLPVPTTPAAHVGEMDAEPRPGLASGADPRPPRSDVHAAAARAHDLVSAVLLGVGVVGVGCVAVLCLAPGTGSGPGAASGVTLAARVLAVILCAALVLRSRLMTAIGTRLPLLAAGMAGFAVLAWSMVRHSTGVGVLLVVGAGALAAVALLVVAASAARSGPSSPYLARAADLLEIAAVVALVPVACAALDLYRWVGHLVG